MARAHNFSAGPAALPLSVLEQLQGGLSEFGGTGMGIMELSHRSKAFDAVAKGAEARLRKLMEIPQDYSVLFLQGGASLQFYMSALNLLRPGEKADYLDTGTWSKKALKEAKRIGDAAAIYSSAGSTYDHVPADGDFATREGTTYLHYTSNNTIFGTQYAEAPKASVPLLADMSSDICGRPVDVSRHDLIYAGAQKNLGPSGVTVVILSPWAIERSRQASLPCMLDYALMADQESLYNTPNTWGIWAIERVLAWLEEQGGVPGMTAANRAKADLLYGEIDRSAFWKGHARPSSRSTMNVTWNLPSAELEARFVVEADAAGLKALKGHRSIGGIRASLYNATGLDAVQALVAFMRDFEAKNG